MLMISLSFLMFLLAVKLSVSLFSFYMFMQMMMIFLLFNSVYMKSYMYFMMEISEISFMLITLSLLVIMLSTMNSLVTLKTSEAFLKMLLMMMFILMMLFLTDSVLSFYCFFEASLIPIFFLIMGWGYQPERFTASMWMVMYTLSASIPLLGLIIFYQEFFLVVNFFILKKKVFFFFSDNLFVYFKSFFLIFGFLVKFPMFFFHTWLPRAHVEAPVSGSMILAALLLKLAGFGILQFLPIVQSLKIILILKSFSIFGGSMVSLICLFEKDMKKLIAYTSVAHMCFVIFVYLSKTKFSILGGSFMMLSHGVCSSGLFSGANQMYQHSHTRSFLFNQSFLSLWPSFSLFWFIFCLANLGGPPTANFFGEVFCIIVLLQMSTLSMLPVMILTFLAAGYSLILYSNTQYGRLNNLKFKFIQSILELSNFLHMMFLFLIMFFMIF